jgi:4-amino-4-deoxy-L-arabinose transferase-like glycosyltransferase
VRPHGDQERSGREIISSQLFWTTLVALSVAAIGMRVLLVAHWTHAMTLGGDPLFFQRVAASLADGHGYSIVRNGQETATALHPPTFPLLLALLDLIGIQSANAHRYALAFISAGAIPLMGLLGRRLLSPVAGLIAAAIAAFGPLWIQPSGKVLSESLYLVVIPLLLVAALRCIDRPSSWRFLVVGLLIGIAALTRSEALSLVVLLGIPLVWFASPSLRTRVKSGLILLVGVGLLVGPWVVRNDLQLGGLVLSTNSGTTIVGAYTATTFNPNSPFYGGFSNAAEFGEAAILKERRPPDHAKRWTERTVSNALSRIGTKYAERHLRDLPGVVLAREGRLWGVYGSGSELQFDLGQDGAGVSSFQVAGQYLNWILIPLAIVGGVVLYRRRRFDFVIVLAPIVATALNAALTFGSTRYRALAEPSIALLAAIGIAVLLKLLWRSLNLTPAASESHGIIASNTGPST